MSIGWIAVLTAFFYLCALFAVAHYGDRHGQRLMQSRARPAIYALTLGVYCTSWTFFGSVGLASSQGLDFLPTYIGPLIVIGLLFPLVLRIVRLAKGQNITSVADFVAARYGKSEQVAALVAIIAVLGAIPYIALQLKAMTATISMALVSLDAGRAVAGPADYGFLSIAIAAVLAGFAMAFGTRHIDATEHQDGLVIAIAMESVVKLAAFLAVGVFVTWFMFDGLGDLGRRAVADTTVSLVVAKQPDPALWLTITLLSAFGIILLPRQFHMAVVENRNERDVRTAAWLFPLYLILINLFVIPLAIAGLLTFPEGVIDRDMTVLALPLEARNWFVTLLVIIGGFSAATAMVIVASVALSIMVSNDLVMPVLLRGRAMRASLEAGNPARTIILIRRISIVGVLVLGYVYLQAASETALVSIGLISFAAIAQIAPAFFIGLFWRRANARGAMAGLIAGVAVWCYTLLLPSLATASVTIDSLVTNGPLGIAPLKPTELFGVELPRLVHGVIFSLAANILAFAGFSLTRAPAPIERLQANIFVGREPGPMGQSLRLWNASVSAADLEATVARYLGAEHTRRAFESFKSSRDYQLKSGGEADVQLLRFAEHLLASGIGAASSRLVLSLLLRRRNLSRDAALKLIDEASATLQYNRDLLQHALDHARQGITVFDADLRLICWNREFKDLFDLPEEFVRVGLGLEELVRFNAERGVYGPGGADYHVGTRLELLVNETEPFRLRVQPGSRVIEIRSARMPDGGLVTTYTDVTQSVATEEALEERVRERTEQLQKLNGELAQAKTQADDANISKTRFLAAASHDILQPLNAARLYATSLVERQARARGASADGDEAAAEMLRNLDLSLESVEEILTALLDISRLDAGAMKAEPTVFAIQDVFDQLRVEFEPLARESGLKLIFVKSTLHVRSDRRLLRRLLQNLISNAIKYTPRGKVLVGCRRQRSHRGDQLLLCVGDTGLGIPQSQQTAIFREFERLAPAARTARGLGLGLSIVERISKVLDHPVSVRSQQGRGSVFSVLIPRSVLPEDQRQGESVQTLRPSKPLDGMCVLAIDNEPRILEGLRALLEGWGCRVLTAADGEEATALLQREHVTPHGVIADYHLDHGDGLSAIDALRREFGIELPAVLITADRTNEVRERAEANEVRVLNKPVRPAALRALLSQWNILQRAAE
ncbi:MAG: response regulator [Alphaproteobacteria bacterium]|nr:response regulator [Alphaproteobacteria bacterium]